MTQSAPPGCPPQSTVLRLASTLLITALLCTVAAAQDTASPDRVDLNPSRPTISNSTGIQSKGVVQVEIGYDAYPRRNPTAEHTVDTAVYYTPTSRVRLDLTWSSLAYTRDPDGPATLGIGTLQLGTKLLLRKEEYHQWQPGIGLQYEAELPTASQKGIQGYGQQVILLLNHHYGPGGAVNFVVNGSFVQTDCQTPQGCTLGGQQSAGINFHPIPPTTVYFEVAAQNVAQSNTPPGTYLFTGFLHRFTDTFGIDGGVRFGVTDGSVRFGTTVGLLFGRRVSKDHTTR